MRRLTDDGLYTTERLSHSAVRYGRCYKLAKTTTWPYATWDHTNDLLYNSSYKLTRLLPSSIYAVLLHLYHIYSPQSNTRKISYR